jgi:hypothetical protein
VYDGLGAQAIGCALERGDTPVMHLVVEDGEGRLVELDDVDAGGCELPLRRDHSPLR